MRKQRLGAEGFRRRPDILIENQHRHSPVTELAPTLRRDDALGFHEGVQDSHQGRALSGVILYVEQLETRKAGRASRGLDFLTITEHRERPARPQEKFRNEDAFVSHLRLAPHMNITGGKPIRKKRRSRASSTRVGNVLRTAAVTLEKTSTELGAYFRNIARRKDRAVAVFATARRLVSHPDLPRAAMGPGVRRPGSGSL